MDEKRIGTQAQGDTAAVWPQFDMHGRPYDRTSGVSTLNIPGGKFVVLPRPHSSKDIEALRDMLVNDEPFRSAGEQAAVAKSRKES